MVAEVVYPLLITDPTGERGGPAPQEIVYDPSTGFFVLPLRGNRGGEGFVRYQVLDDEQLVMLADLVWLAA